MTHRTADELAEEGRRLGRAGHLIVFLYPSQQWMAVEMQMPFQRYEGMDYADGEKQDGEKS